MGLWSRKFRVGLISLGAVLGVYLLYSLVSTTPSIEIDEAPEFEDIITDGNIGRLDGEMGAFGKVGVGTVEKARFVQLNEDKQIESIFGFERLLHDEGDEWVVEKPYMDVFQFGPKCCITADTGNTRIETVAGRPRPKYAKFTGNVVAHIVPRDSSDVKEGFLYLDDITFLSEESQFSTPGPVKYLSEDLRMLGRGLDFIYNEHLQRVDLLRIIHLESLHLKGTQVDISAKADAEPNNPADANNQTQTKPPEKTVTSDYSQKTDPISDSNTQPSAQKEDQMYRCIFSKNVVMDSPEQLVIALEKLSIKNIFRPVDLTEQSDPCSPVDMEESAPGNDTDIQKEQEPNTPSSPNLPPEEQQLPVDIVVTCDNGFVLTPMDSNRSDTVFENIGSEQSKDSTEKLKQLMNTDDRNLFIAEKIDYCAATRDTIATGLSELKFYTSDFMNPDANEAVVPVRITAQEKALFLPAESRALFEGDCICTVLRQDPNGQQKYILSAPKLTVDLQEQKGKQLSAMASKIAHLTAAGPTARLAIAKMAQEELLGGFELKCTRIDYNDTEQFFLATGPGVVKVDNSKISEPNQDSGRFSMRRKSYSIVENFDNLKYYIETNQVIAEAEGQGVVVNYFPIVDGKYDRHITVTAGRIIGNLMETPTGQTELSTLHAMHGVTYREEDMEFAGRKLFYDVGKSVITVQGDESQPCIFNGSLVDEIKYDLKTRKAKFQIVGPGTLLRK